MSYEKLIENITYLIVKIVPKKWYKHLSLFKGYIFKGYGKIFYSQDGIDAIIKNKLIGTKNIFYVDVGANHPIWASNTYAFYKNGGKGINIDAAPGQLKFFKLIRRRDINLEVPISNNTTPQKFYIFEDAAFNTFSEKEAKERLNIQRLKQTLILKPRKLSEVLDHYLPSKQKIEFLSVDVEGHELSVLLSNNWEKYRPHLIVVEQLVEDIKGILESKVYDFLKEQGYSLIAFSEMNALYELKF